MLPINPVLLQYMSSIFQMDQRRPNGIVQIVHPLHDQPGDYGIYQIDRLQSVDIARTYDSPAAEFEFVADDTWGWLSPDYGPNKFPDLRIDRGDPAGNPWIGVLRPNTRVIIHLGYGDQLVRQLTGLIDVVTINALEKTITVRGRSMYKRLLVETPPEPLKWENKRPDEILTDIHNQLSMSIEAEQVSIFGTNDPYIIPLLEIARGITYHMGIQDVIDTVYGYIKTRANGVTIFKKKRIATAQEEADYVLDEAINLTEMEYGITDYNIFNALTVTCGEDKNSYEDQGLRAFCRNGFREEIIDIPWATTEAKRSMAAMALFRFNRQKIRSLTIGAVGNPAVELYDLCRIREHVSTATQNYLVKEIRTSYSKDGYFDIMSMEMAM